MCIAILCQPNCDVKNFEIDLIFLIKPFILKSQEQKCKYRERKKLLKRNKKHFSLFLKVFHLSKKINFVWNVRVRL